MHGVRGRTLDRLDGARVRPELRTLDAALILWGLPCATPCKRTARISTTFTRWPASKAQYPTCPNPVPDAKTCSTATSSAQRPPNYPGVPSSVDACPSRRGAAFCTSAPSSSLPLVEYPRAADHARLSRRRSRTRRGGHVHVHRPTTTIMSRERKKPCAMRRPSGASETADVAGYPLAAGARARVMAQIARLSGGVMREREASGGTAAGKERRKWSLCRRFESTRFQRALPAHATQLSDGERDCCSEPARASRRRTPIRPATSAPQPSSRSPSSCPRRTGTRSGSSRRGRRTTPECPLTGRASDRRAVRGHARLDVGAHSGAHAAHVKIVSPWYPRPAWRDSPGQGAGAPNLAASHVRGWSTATTRSSCPRLGAMPPYCITSPAAQTPSTPRPTTRPGRRPERRY